jgi:hypothetical protein
VADDDQAVSDPNRSKEAAATNASDEASTSDPDVHGHHGFVEIPTNWDDMTDSEKNSEVAEMLQRVARQAGPLDQPM